MKFTSINKKLYNISDKRSGNTTPQINVLLVGVSLFISALCNNISINLSMTPL